MLGRAGGQRQTERKHPPRSRRCWPCSDDAGTNPAAARPSPAPAAAYGSITHHRSGSPPLRLRCRQPANPTRQQSTRGPRREVVAALPPYGLRPCLPAVSMSSPATAPSLTFSTSPLPVPPSPSLPLSFVRLFVSAFLRPEKAAAERSAELLRGLCCLSVAAAPALLALPLPARSSSLLSPRPDGHRRVASGGPHLWPAPERVRSALPLLHALTFMSPTAFNGVACPARPPNTAMGHGYSQGQG